MVIVPNARNRNAHPCFFSTNITRDARVRTIGKMSYLSATNSTSRSMNIMYSAMDLIGSKPMSSASLRTRHIPMRTKAKTSATYAMLYSQGPLAKSSGIAKKTSAKGGYSMTGISPWNRGYAFFQ